MTKEQLDQLRDLSEKVWALHEATTKSDVINLYAATAKVLPDGGTMLSGNREGLIYFASILLSLASEASPGQHFHYDAHTVLTECEVPMILQYLPAPWEKEESKP